MSNKTIENNELPKTTKIISNSGVNKQTKSTSSKAGDILGLNPENPIVKTIYERMMKSMEKNLASNKKQNISVIFQVPSISGVRLKGFDVNEEEFHRILNYTVGYVLSKLKISPKWETESNQDNKIIKTGYDLLSSVNGVPKRKIKFFFSDDSKYLRVDGAEPIDERDGEINVVIDYRNEPQKNANVITPRSSENTEGQTKYRYVEEHTKLLEIIKTSGGKYGVDVLGRLIKFKKGIPYEISCGEGISIEEIPNSNRLFYYSNKSGFVSVKERTNKNGIIELDNISIIDKISVPNLDFDISLGEDKNDFYDKKSFVDINVEEDVINGPHRLRGNLTVGKNVKTNVEIDGNLKATSITSTVGQPIKITATGNVETTSLYGSNITSPFISFKNIDSSSGELNNTYINGDNTIHTNAVEMINLSLRGNLTLDIGEEFFEEKERLTEKIKVSENDIKTGENEFKSKVKQIDEDILANFEYLATKKEISVKSLNEVKKIFTAIRSLLRIDPFQIDKVMQFLDYLHKKHEFDFIWGYKIKFNNIDHIYKVVKKNKEKLETRKNKLEETKIKMDKLVICINGKIERSGDLILQYGEKTISKAGHIINKKKNISFKDDGQIKIYKKYSLASKEFVDITEEEAQKLIKISEEENKKIF